MKKLRHTSANKNPNHIASEGLNQSLVSSNLTLAFFSDNTSPKDFF